MPRSLAFRSTLCSALAVLALLAACSPRGEAGAGVPPVAAASAPGDADLARDLERLERASHAKPALYEQELRARGGQLPEGSAALLDVLALRGLLAAEAGDRALCDQIVDSLHRWPAGDMRASAVVAAASVGAECLFRQGDLAAARRLLTAVDPQQLGVAGPIFRWRHHFQLASIASDSGDLDASLAASHSALRLAEQIGRPWRVALTLSDLAFTTLRADTPARAHQLVAQALAEALKDPDPVTLNRIHTMRGIVHTDDPDQSVTLQASMQALEEARRAGSDGMRAMSLANLADYYLQHHQPARALALASEALPLARAARQVGAERVALTNIGLAKIEMGRLAEGRAQAQEAVAMLERQGALGYASGSWDELARYLEKAGDLAGAVAAYREYRRVNDRVLRDETRKLLLEAQERQDAEQRARDIELLNRDNALKAEQVRQHNLALMLWAALAACVAVSLGLLYQVSRRMRRTNEALAQSNALLKRQSETDPLTGLANRRHFQTTIGQLVGPQGLTASVFLIDVDHFKRINDSFGHAAGDAVLIELVRRLREAVCDDDLIVRWGGEEFLIVARTRGASHAPQLAQRLLDLIGGRPVVQAGCDIPVTASIGFVSLPLPPHGLALTWERAIDLVDTALYLAKAHGRNKAYGVQRMEATDAVTAAQLAARLESAWSDGRVDLLALSGPGVAMAPSPSGLLPLDDGPPRPAAA